MSHHYQTPGVYIEEISKFPPSVVAVETAIPAFIGYTERTTYQGRNLQNTPVKIRSMLDYETLFGGPFPEAYELALDQLPDGNYQIKNLSKTTDSRFHLYYGLRLFYANGGGPCYIVAVGTYQTGTSITSIGIGDNQTGLLGGLHAIRKYDEPTLIVFPDATSLNDENDFYFLYGQALQQCADRKDRFTIIDTPRSSALEEDIATFRQGIGINHLSYGAVYYPWLETSIAYHYDPASITVSRPGIPPGLVLKLSDGDAGFPENSLAHRNQGQTNSLYQQALRMLDANRVILPPACLMAGVFSAVDSSRGVFKAPANVSLNGVGKPLIKIDAKLQEELNVHTSGKSVNVIRQFPDKGLLVWGARTLDGNSNEWKYISVRRYFIYAEESAKKAVERFVFEPNDINTWTKVRSMLTNFFLQEWRSGALQGNKPEDAFRISIGLGETMTPDDLNNGRMVVEIALAVVRPAEFIVLRFSHMMAQA